MGFKALFCSHSSGTSRGLTGTSDAYDEADVLYHDTCWDIMLFVPHRHSVMPQDVTLLSSAALLLLDRFSIHERYTVASDPICTVIFFGGCEKELI